MHTHEKWLRDDAWQDVVDGQLTRDQLQELLVLCEQRPELWRRCAIAFLEEQALEQELKELTGRWPQAPLNAQSAVVDVAVASSDTSDQAQSDQAQSDQPQSDQPQGGAFTMSSVPSHVVGSLVDQPEPTPSAASISEGNTNHRRGSPSAAPHSLLLNNLALAASVTLAFLIGWQASRRMGGELLNSSKSSITAGVLPAGDSRGSQIAHAGSDQFQLVDDASNSQLVGATPQNGSGQQDGLSAASFEEFAADAITEALQSPDHFVPIDRRIPRELADLEQRGLLRLESTEGFVPVRLKDGSTAVVPFQQIDVRPKRNAY